MRGSSWIVAIAIVAVAFGFGHIGCYTSGTPGGLGAGGAPDAATPGNSSGGDASTTGTGGTATCQSNEQCVGRNDNKKVCSRDGGPCVECVVDIDCVLPLDPDASADSGADTTDRYCLHSVCEPFASCETALDCPLGQDAGVCDSTSKHCVRCLSSSDCATGTTCFGRMCRLPCTSDLTCTKYGLLCSNIDGGFCVELCSIDSDCYPGNVCKNSHCMPAL
jgi:hypothetical protein